MISETHIWLLEVVSPPRCKWNLVASPGTVEPYSSTESRKSRSCISLARLFGSVAGKLLALFATRAGAGAGAATGAATPAGAGAGAGAAIGGAGASAGAGATPAATPPTPGRLATGGGGGAGGVAPTNGGWLATAAVAAVAAVAVAWVNALAPPTPNPYPAAMFCTPAIVGGQAMAGLVWFGFGIGGGTAGEVVFLGTSCSTAIASGPWC